MTGPHTNARVLTLGKPLGEAAAVILLHGRGASAENILGLAGAFERPDLTYLAPEAASNVWYPLSFLAPIEHNEPFLSSALELVAATMRAAEAKGVPAERIVLGGFSQGACLTLEFASRNPRRYGGLLAFSGGLIGPEADASRYNGSLDGTPVFLGCSDVDPHIPLARVQESTAILTGLSGAVTEKIYPGMAHTINDDEIEAAKRILDELAG